MQVTPLIGKTALVAAAVLFFSPGFFASHSTAATVGSTISDPPAGGHFVLVVEGDRDQLAVTTASHKQDPWGGVRRGFTSTWALSIRDRNGAELANVPLDVSPFAVEPAAKGRPLQVEGCIVRDSKIGMLVNAPCLADAATYVFLRDKTVLGTVDATAMNQLAAGAGR